MPFPDRTVRSRSAVRTTLAALFLGLAAAPGLAQSVRLAVPEENFRKEPRVSSGNRLATVLEGAVMAVEGREGRWHRVTLEGWIWRPSVSPDDREGMDLVVSKAGGENLRERPDAGSRRVAILERGMLLDSLETSGSWVRVRRTAWIWSGSVSELSGRPDAERIPAVAVEGPTPAPATEERRPAEAGRSLPDRLVVTEAPVRLLVSPEGDTIAVLRPGADVAVLARQGEWARVRLEGWVWEPSTLPSDSAAATDSLTAADLRANPEQFVGRRVRWSVQYVSLERAEAVRTDFYEGEPFLLARPLDRSQGFVYVAVPPELLPAVERLRPLQTIQILGRVRTGRSALMGVPILDLLALR
ncbi:MAG: SH3 domain-containing protein [Gemmatimonadota bacterium]